MTNTELERRAYIEGRATEAALYALAADADRASEGNASAIVYIEEARGCFAVEDCLGDVIKHCRALAQGRVTKADITKLIELLEDTERGLAQEGEHGADLLRQAQGAL